MVINCLTQSYTQLFSHLRQELNDFPYSEELIYSLKESLTDPELPFPKLRKQNIGIHCNSGFQFFLVDKLFPMDEEELMEETYEELKNYLAEEWSNPI